ncbi:MAG: TonB-dependent receptor [bacterium]
MWRFLLCVIILSVCGAKGTANVEQQESFDSPKELEDSIIVTANRFGLTKQESVWPVNVIDLKDDLKDNSLSIALEGESGIDIRNFNGFGSVSTMSSWGVFNRHMLLLYNGRVVKDYSLGGFNLADFSINEFERIEILKGPQSAFYGSDAVGGVINFISPGSFTDHLNFSSVIGSNNLQQYNIETSKHFGLVGVGVYGEHSSSDNNRDNAGAKRDLISLKNEFLSNNGNHKLSLYARYFNDSLGAPGPVPDSYDIPVYGNEESTSLTDCQQDKNYSVDLQYRFIEEKSGQFQVDMFWEKKELDYFSLYNYQYSYQTTDSSSGNAIVYDNIDSVDVRSYSNYNKRSSGITTRYSKDFENLFLAGGIDWLSGSLHSEGKDSSFATNIVGQFAPFSYNYESGSQWVGRQNQFDLWSNLSFKGITKVHFDISGRLQFVKGRATQPSYNTGVAYFLNDNLIFKLGYAYAFRLPSLAEQFADDVYTAGNTELDSETAHSLHGTMMFSSQDDKFQFESTIFYQKIKSLIQYQYDPIIFRSIPVNYDKFRSTGVDLNMNYKFSGFIKAGLYGVYQKASQTYDEFSEYKNANYVPEMKWGGDLSFTRGKLKGDINLKYTSERQIRLYGGSLKYIDRVYEFGMHFGMQVTRMFYIGVSGYDLTDQKRPDQFGFTMSDGDYPSLGRRFEIKVKSSIL